MRRASVGPTVARVREEEEEEEEGSEGEEAPLVKKTRIKPTVHRWNIWPSMLLLWFLGSAAFYFFVRITQRPSLYGYLIMGVELLGITSFLPYAILLVRGIYPNHDATGLPEAGSPEAQQMTPPAKSAAPSHANLATTMAISASPAPYRVYSTCAPLQPGQPMSCINNTSYLSDPNLVLDSPMVQRNLGLGFGLGMTQRLVEEEVLWFHVRVLVPCYKEPLHVIQATLDAARSALLPAYTRRTIYLCDDGKDPEKQALVARMGPDVIYVTGRKRKHGEVNGKSANLNNCLKNVIYANHPRHTDTGEIDWTEISNRECLVVFDADMCAKPEFFTRMLEVMMDDNLALVLSPQSFHNIKPETDIFNNINKQFWECWLPGAFAWGYIACTGTNFCIRTRALAHCGWFPEYTITEDYALGMELKCHGYQATYLMLYLAVGEAPEEIRNVFRQRSRWTKGHFQVFLSHRNPMLNMRLPFFQRLWYSYAAWAPISTIVTVPVFTLVPVMSIVFGFNPVTITFYFVLASTTYFLSLQTIQNYSYQWGDWQLMWWANISNTVLWFTYTKALINSVLSLVGAKTIAFKVTEKTQPTNAQGGPAGPGANLGADQPAQPESLLQRVVSRILSKVPGRTPSKNPYRLPQSVTKPKPLRQHAGDQNVQLLHERPSLSPKRGQGSAQFHLAAEMVPMQHADGLRPVKEPPGYQCDGVVAAGGHAAVRSGGATSPLQYLRGPTTPAEKGKSNGRERLKAVLASFRPANIREFDKMFDPLALFVLFLVSIGTSEFPSSPGAGLSTSFATSASPVQPSPAELFAMSLIEACPICPLTLPA
ncbi:nucleotide-diphospho-sugar transferase [Haematococcus lacustris]